MANVHPARISTGISGLDLVLKGGLIPERAYLVQGGAGSGKTTLGLHFLTAEPSEPALFVTLGEHVDQLREDARLQGFDLGNVSFLDLTPVDDDSPDTETYQLMAPSEVEPGELGARIRESFEEALPLRVFIDSLSHFGYLAPDAFQHRKQVMGLLRYLTRKGATVLSAAEASGPSDCEELEFLSDGIIRVGWGRMRRSLQVSKFRGSGFASGDHTLVLDEAGATCYPRLEPRSHARSHDRDELGTGLPAVDLMLEGGLTKGTVTIITGPTGVGKTTFGLQFLKRAAERGERSVLYSFEENLQTLVHRAESTGIPFSKLHADGNLSIETIEPLRYSADMFTERLRHEVEERNASVVMIDSMSGYQLSIAGADVVQRVLALTRYLTNMGVTVLLTNEVDAIAGTEVHVTENGISFLSDCIIMLRYLEIQGELRKAIGVLKKRTGDFEKTLREFDITSEGIRVGEPLTGLRGVLRGNPEMMTRPSGQRD